VNQTTLNWAIERAESVCKGVIQKDELYWRTYAEALVILARRIATYRDGLAGLEHIRTPEESK